MQLLRDTEAKITSKMENTWKAMIGVSGAKDLPSFPFLRVVHSSTDILATLGGLASLAASPLALPPPASPLVLPNVIQPLHRLDVRRHQKVDQEQTLLVVLQEAVTARI